MAASRTAGFFGPVRGYDFRRCGVGVSNVRQIDPQNRAVVLRLGALDRIQNAGLLLAWPRPFEQVVIVPAADRVSERRVENLLRSDAALQADRVATFATPINDALAGSGIC